MSETKACTSCASSISVKASVCKHCQRSQGRWGTFDRTISALPMILAAFSAIAVTLSFVRPWVFPPQSELVASFQRYANDRISFIVTNVGERAGAIEHINLTYFGADRSGTGFDLLVEEKDETLVRPSSTVRVTATASERMKELIWAAYQTKTDKLCDLGLLMVKSSGQRQWERVQTPCWQATIAVLPERRQEIITELDRLSGQ